MKSGNRQLYQCQLCGSMFWETSYSSLCASCLDVSSQSLLSARRGGSTLLNRIKKQKTDCIISYFSPSKKSVDNNLTDTTMTAANATVDLTEDEVVSCTALPCSTSIPLTPLPLPPAAGNRCNPLSPDINSLQSAPSSSFCASIDVDSSISVADSETITIASDTWHCLICDCAFPFIDESNCEKHINQCLSSFQLTQIALTQGQSTCDSSSVTNGAGDGRAPVPPIHLLHAAEFICPICDEDLSRRSLWNRCSHLKACAKKYWMPTKELLQLIAPIALAGEGDGGQGEDDEGEDNDDEVCITEYRAHMKHGDVSKAKHGDTESNSGNNANKQNAFALLMQNAKSIANANIRKSNDGGGGFNRGVPASKQPAGSAVASSSSDKPEEKGRSWKGKSNRSGREAGYAPNYKQIRFGNMRFPIVVDGFQYAHEALSDCYFLTHFHSDHYTGLDNAFDCGKIYCSPTTAGLVRLRLHVDAKKIVPLEMEVEHQLEVAGDSVRVVLLEANHCPGAVCLLFSFSSGKKVLHTGDFRWSSHLLQSSQTYAQLARCQSNPSNLTVYLDTTYCDPTYDFPPQHETIDAVVRCVRMEISRNPRVLFIFGAYGIGKERVFMAVAEALNKPVFVDKTRWKGMMCYDWPTAQLARLTTDDTKTNIWVTAMGHVNFNMIKTYKQKRDGRFVCERVVGFQPTGWTQGSNAPSYGSNSNNPINRNSKSGSKAVSEDFSLSNDFEEHERLAKLLIPRHKDGNTIYSVPYSEHSSFSELVSFVKTFRPQKVIPTVNTSVEKVKLQLDTLLAGCQA